MTDMIKIKYYIEKLEEAMIRLQRLENLAEDVQVISRDLRREMSWEINKFYQEEK